MLLPVAPIVSIILLSSNSPSLPSYTVTPSELQLKLNMAIGELPSYSSYTVKNLCFRSDNTEPCKKYIISSPDGASIIMSLDTFKVPLTAVENDGEERVKGKEIKKKSWSKYRSSYSLFVQPLPFGGSSDIQALQGEVVDRVEFSLCGKEREKSLFCRE